MLPRLAQTQRVTRRDRAGYIQVRSYCSVYIASKITTRLIRLVATDLVCVCYFNHRLSGPVGGGDPASGVMRDA